MSYDGGETDRFEPEYPECRLVELVLLRNNGRAPEPSAIAWERRSPEAESAQAYLGQGEGYRWYGRGHVYCLDDLQCILKLQGGDSLLDPLLRAYRSSPGDLIALRRVVRAGGGSEIFPGLEQELQRETAERRAWVIERIGLVPGRPSVALLERLYRSGNRTDSDAAAFALGLDPQPLDSREACLAALRSNGGAYGYPEVASAVSTAAAGRWPETLPYLNTLIDIVYPASGYRHCWCAIRAVEGKPVPQELERAFDVLRRMGPPWDRAAVSDAEIARAKQTIVRTSDPEAATVMALDYATHRALDGYTYHENPPEVGNLAREILRELPRDVTLRVLGEVKFRGGKVGTDVHTTARKLIQELLAAKE